MITIPILELRSGHCTHSVNDSKPTTTREDPMAVVGELVAHGAQHIIFIDVDAIQSGQPEHLALLKRLKNEFSKVNFQLSAGVKSNEDILIWLDSGADFVTVGSRLLKQPNRLDLILAESGRQVILSLDVKVDLWDQGYCPILDLSLDDWLQALEDEEVAALMFTEVPNSGHVTQHNLAAASELTKRTRLPIIAHGGLQSSHDLSLLADSRFQKLHGITVTRPMQREAFGITS